MTYIDPSATPFVQLQQIGVQSAYTTLAEETSKKAVLSYHYEAKRNICIASVVAIVALACILGPTFNKHLYMLALGSFVPIALLSFFKGKHSNLEKLHKIDYDACFDILRGITNYINGLRNEKIKLLNETVTANQKDGGVNKALLQAEDEFDKNTSYNQVCSYAKNAHSLISRRYENETIYLCGPVSNFLKACEFLIPEKVLLTSREFSSGKLFAEWRQVVEHPYNSLLPRPNTVLVMKPGY